MSCKFRYKFHIDRDWVFLQLYCLWPERDPEKIGDTRVKRGTQFEDLLLAHPSVEFVGWRRQDTVEDARKERGVET